MSRAITIGNGSMLVGIDQYGHVRDFYYPFVGHANHVSGASGSYTHRVGVWVDGTLKWLSDPSWQMHVETCTDSGDHYFEGTNHTLGIHITLESCVHNERNLFLRKISVKNLSETARTVKVFFAQEFRISESRRGDTAFYDPRVTSIIHYKGHEVFLIYATNGRKPFNDYSVGLFGIENREGTYADAEDGVLSRNPIEHGSVDSVLGVGVDMEPQSTAELHYWIAVGKNIAEVHALHQTVFKETPNVLMESTRAYWRAWLHKGSDNLGRLEKKLQQLFYTSLRIIRTHTDNGGGIIASSDSDMLNQGRDSYSYVWPRDSAISAHALDRGGYTDSAQRYFSFVSKLLEVDGYLMHKYRVDGVLGSSWHPWIHNGIFELPIQEDETALPLYMLARHYEYAKDLEFIESLYNPFIEPAADFLAGFIDHETGLPSGSYDLWEEKFGSSTYTASAVYGALRGAAELSALLGKRTHADKYRNRAEQIKQGILGYLYDASLNSFIKLMRYEHGTLIKDHTLDMSSFHGVVFFDVLDPNDPRVTRMHAIIQEKLKVPGSFGGYMRYEGDNYYRTGPHASPNAWCITTLWMAQYYIKIARTKKELSRAYDILLWMYDCASESGVLPEQIHPETGAHLSTAPLVWSHAEYIITVDEYLKKAKSLSS